MKHIGNLTITKQNADDFKALEEVTGWLDISADSNLPALTSVGCWLGIFADSDLPALTSVGGGLDIRAESNLPALTSVGGWLNIYAEAALPALKVAYGANGQLVAVKKYGLWRSDDGLYYAGCKGPLTLEKARRLAQVWGEQEIAQFFIKAIEESKND